MSLLNYYEKIKSEDYRNRNYMLYVSAKIDENNTVVDVIVLNETDITDENGLSDTLATNLSNTLKNTTGNWKIAGMFSEGTAPAYRGIQPGISDLWHPTKEKFYGYKPHSSWTLNEETLEWEPPIPRPNNTTKWHWNDDTLTWELYDNTFFTNPETYSETSGEPDNENYGGTL